MSTKSLSSHARLAILDRFAPYEIIEDSTRDTRAGTEGRFHIWGQMDGKPVDVLLRWGGVYTHLTAHCASMEPLGQETLTPEAIVRAVMHTLEPTSRKD
jgi:hypothetical protein|tara:strand:- start:374 stop:670 length:297 start_codon:yes stop_codon:yes gene_type:complete